MLLSPNDPIFCWLSLLSPVPKDPTFFGEMWALRSLSPKDPLFFAFGCHRKLLFVSISSTNLIIFAIFDIFFSNALPAFKALTERSKVTFSPNRLGYSLILNQNLASHPMTHHFLRLCSHRMPQPLEMWALHPYPFDIGVPPPRTLSPTVELSSVSFLGYFVLFLKYKNFQINTISIKRFMTQYVRWVKGACSGRAHWHDLYITVTNY